ncbi:MAG TPA: M3 family oligoendopeptidase [Bacteroidia bacterium]|nr:M3 family oligoendopeptidase [Bacteroidia bacterium]
MNGIPTEAGTKLMRHYLPEQLSFQSWEELEPFFAALADREISTPDALMEWLRDLNELSAAFEEELAWRYIRSTCDTTNKEFEAAYDFFVTAIEPNASPWFHQLNNRLHQHPLRDTLDKNLYAIYLRAVRNELEIYRSENIPLFTEIDQLKQDFGKIAGDMTVEVDGNELTIQQANNYFKSTDRTLRRSVFEKIWTKRLAAKMELNHLFDKLSLLRQQVAKNAGFENFSDYCFTSLGRFDYSKADCFHFHDSVEAEVVPFIRSLDEKRRQKLSLEQLRPWDLDVDTDGKTALRPFTSGEELITKTITCLQEVRPQFAGYISIMRGLGHFDLDSRRGKAPGGYNYSLAETGVPFIFMNAAGSHRDLVTMVHEAGHAIHSFLENPLPFNKLKSPPSEVCELASMSMELISMEHWHIFYPDADDLNRAKKEQLEKVLSTLPWVANVDAFQHWLYENAEHSHQERAVAWEHFIGRFDSPADWSGFEEVRRHFWQKQLHIFEMPFYYIEYGMAQLGAIAMWRNYRKDPEGTLDAYEAALKLGYTKPIGEIYKTAGIRFDFSREYVRELVQFVKVELEKLN